MEGLIPFVYRAIVQYKSGGQGLIDTWLNESPSAAYMRLPGDSDRFQTTSDVVNAFRSSDCGFSPSTTPQPPPSTTAQRNVVPAVVDQSPVRRRVVA
ncbi:hypothetical protein RHGRI_015297 [Rhododendron griersonianum]|uniref:Uncharacterized protein n=1 Tax=Rhododendron griersonianum TaxID=479676 RepID=A0AAV6KCQ0_9ERIC|nr:hypothetical protein RHGRI_015297 [Rhododendron griersonianum]